MNLTGRAVPIKFFIAFKKKGYHILIKISMRERKMQKRERECKKEFNDDGLVMYIPLISIHWSRPCDPLFNTVAIGIMTEPVIVY